jgi:hypothetical protein
MCTIASGLTFGETGSTLDLNPHTKPQSSGQIEAVSPFSVLFGEGRNRLEFPETEVRSDRR